MSIEVIKGIIAIVLVASIIPIIYRSYKTIKKYQKKS